MRPRLTAEPRLPRRSAVDTGSSPPPLHPAGLLSTIFLAVILMTASSVLGAARLWIELPLLGGVALVLLLQAMRLSFVPRSLRQLDAIDLAALLFTAYALVRWLTSPTEYFSRLEAMNVVGYAVIFFTCRYGLSRRTYGLALIILLVVLGVVETGFGYSLSQHSNIHDPHSLWYPFGPTETLHLYYAPRWVGTYGCPNHYGALLVMAVGASLAVGCFSKFAWPLRIVFFYAAAVMMIGVIYSGSRGACIGLLSCIAGLTFFGLRNGTLRWWIPTLGALLLVGVVAGIVASSSVLQDRLAEAESTVNKGNLQTYIRVELAKDALIIAHDYPLFGTGPGTFIFIDPRYQDSTFAFEAMLTHDDYLNCLTDYGLVGFAIAIFFVILVTLTFCRALRAEVRWQDRTLVATGFAAWCALSVHSLLDFNLHIPANAMMLFALTGLGLRPLSGPETADHWSTLSLAPLGRWLGGGLLVFGLAYGIEVGRTAWSDIGYEETFADVKNQPTIQSIQSLQDALAVDPGNASALVLLGDLYRVRASMREDREGQLSEGNLALAAYHRAWKASSLDDAIQARRGLVFDLFRQYPEALACYQEAVTKQPYNGEFWKGLGGHYWQTGELEKAVQAYRQASYCPHGNGGGASYAGEVQAILDARKKAALAPPASATPAEPYVEPQTLP